MRRVAAIVALGLVGVGGVAAAFAVSGDTGRVSVCVGAKTPAETIAVNGAPVHTVPSVRHVDCRTVTYTIPTRTETTTETQVQTQTETTTQTTTLPGTTVTQPVTTTVTETTTLPAQTVTTTTTLPAQTTTVAPTTTSAPPPPPPPPPGTTANLWVSNSGLTTCTRNASPVDYATALAAGNVCNTGPTAYTKALLGDTVLVETSTFTTPWNFAKAMTKTGTPGTCNYNYGGTADLTACITIEQAAGQTWTFDAPGTNVPQVSICVNYLSLRGATFKETDYSSGGVTVSNYSVGIGRGDTSCLPNGGPPHDIYLAENTYGGQAGWVGGAYNVWYVGGVAASATDFPWQGGGKGNNGGTAYVHDDGIVGMTFDGFNFRNTAPSSHHMECDHFDGGADHITIADSSIRGCPVESMFFETEGSGSITNTLVENNYFDGGAALEFSCHNPGCTMSGNTVRFNSFHATRLTLLNDCANAPNTCTGSAIDKNLVYGNIGDGCPANPPMGVATGSGWKSGGYNIEGGAQQGICTGDNTGAYHATIAFASPGPPDYLLDLLGTQTATGFVPPWVPWPAANRNGVPRSGAATDAGAD